MVSALRSDHNSSTFLLDHYILNLLAPSPSHKDIMTTEHAQLSNWRNELTPNIVDHLAKVLPDSPYALYPNSPVTYDEGYRTVTYKGFANAVNGLAWWLHENLGPSKNFDVLAYIGPNDVRYTALLLGAIKAGYVVSLLFTTL
jgi:acyl-coenzyme A synthetase/AMP-(fatty) acid ligase